MEWFKRLKEEDPYLLLSWFVLAAGLTLLFLGFLILGIDHFHPTDARGKILAFLCLGFGVLQMLLFLITSSKYRQRQTDARLRGLAKYVEELRAFTVPRLDTVLEVLDLYEKPEIKNESQTLPPAVDVPTEPAIEKPLGTRERDTLLTIIAVLAKEAKVDIKTPGKSALFIQGLTDELGAHVSKRAIEDHLKKIPDALETRMK